LNEALKIGENGPCHAEGAWHDLCDLVPQLLLRNWQNALRHSRSTSAASNYRAACRARSHREFISKIAVAVEEADESVGWFEVIIRAGLATGEIPTAIHREASELLAILAASRRTAEARNRNWRSRHRVIEDWL